jgi:ribonuclease T2
MNQQRLLKSIVSLLVLAAVAGYSAYERAPGKVQSPRQDRPQRSSQSFDYYLASLSWSPTYCESNPDDREQCGRRGYGFILHGLWPQYEQGGGPQNCAGDERPGHQTIARTLAIMPSRRLIEHEWRSHGRCSGLAPDAYFELADRAYAAIRIPPSMSTAAKPRSMTAEQLRAEFVEANPGMQINMLAVNCDGDKLDEVRICLDETLQMRSCGRNVRMRCPRGRPLRIPLIH